MRLSGWSKSSSTSSTLSPRERVPEGRVRVLDFDEETAPGGETTRLHGDAGPKRKHNSFDHPLIHTREPCLTKPTD